jgi:hypothetical protein
MLYVTTMIRIAILSLVFGLVCSPLSADRTAENVSRGIKDRLESELFAFAPSIQRHYATRMYRVTGDERYIYPIIFDMMLLTRRLSKDASALFDEQHILRRTQELLNSFEEDTRKGEMRREAFSKRGNLLWLLDMVYICEQMKEYGLDEGEDRKAFLTVVAYLRKVDFASMLLDTALIRVYSPQLANFVYYLQNLGIVDLRQEYSARFRSTFPDSLDDQLTSDEFEDKIYGLTHIIIAVSAYYQFRVSPEQFGWILGYLHENIDAILQETRPDVIAEVGVCFLVADEEDSPVIAKCRSKIIDMYDEKSQTVLSTSGNDELEAGEHRNVLAYMLLNWPTKLHPGPFLPQCGRFLKLQPK